MDGVWPEQTTPDQTDKPAPVFMHAIDASDCKKVSCTASFDLSFLSSAAAAAAPYRQTRWKPLVSITASMTAFAKTTFSRVA